MFFRASLGFAAAAAVVSAAPVQQESSSIVLPLKRVANFSSMKSIVQSGEAKISKINSGSKLTARQSSGSITNEDVTYVAPIVVGGRTWDLIVDTGCMLVVNRQLCTLN